MYKFSDFLLVEKVSKSDINSVLTDKNIEVGIEFEFYIDDLESSSEANYEGYTAQEMDSMYQDFKDKIDKWIKDVEDEKENYWKSHIDNLRLDLAVAKQKEVDTLQAEIDRLKPLLTNFATTNVDEIQSDIDENQEIIDNLKTDIEDLNDAELDSDLEEMLANENVMEYEDQFEYLNENLPHVPEMTYYLYNFYESVGASGHEDIRFYEIMTGESETRLEIFDAYAPSGYMEGWENEEDRDSENLENYDWSDLPFDANNALISGSYHGNEIYSKWRIETDPSVSGGGGVEIVSPILSIQEAVKIIPKMFKFISEHGHTSEKTGLHINLSYKGKDLSKMDTLKLMILVDEKFVWDNFPDRENNSYTQSVLQNILSKIRQDAVGDEHLAITKPLLKKFKAKTKGPVGKYFGVNTTHENRIEFRYLGGNNYEKKKDLVIRELGKFAYYMKVSLDPSERKKEYESRMTRLYNKFIDTDRPTLSASNTRAIINKVKRGKDKKYQRRLLDVGYTFTLEREYKNDKYMKKFDPEYVYIVNNKNKNTGYLVFTDLKNKERMIQLDKEHMKRLNL